MGGLASLCVLLGLFATPWIQLLGRAVIWLDGGVPLHGFRDLPLPTVGKPLLSVWAAVIIGLAAALFIGILSRMLGGRTKIDRRPPWACGERMTPDMMMTASGYSKSIRVAFQGILRPARLLHRVEGTNYFPRKFQYNSYVKAFAENFLYRPVLDWTIRLARGIRTIQNGQVQTYLVYLFVTLLVVLLMAEVRG
jgi:hydrogenase-4 component B